MDADLNRINTHAKLDYRTFKTELAISFDVEEGKVDFLRSSVKMEPAEIYFVLELSKISNGLIDHVIEVYKLNKVNGQG